MTAACVMALGLGLVATGCSAGGSVNELDTRTPPTIASAPPPPVTGYDGLIGLPLSAYGTSEQDDHLLYRTNEALIARCMTGLGHRGYLSERRPQSTSRTKSQREAVRPAGAWGYIGSATAERLGFHVAVPVPKAKDPVGRELKDYNTCWKRADKEIPSLAGTRGWKLAQDLFGRSFRQTAADSRVKAARERWATCMGEAGHPAGDPEKLADGFLNAEKVTPREIDVATAAESCTRSSRLAGIYFAVLTGYQRQLVSAHTDVLTGYQRQVRERIERAEAILSAHPTATHPSTPGGSAA
ncbi:hypothetical protein [Streptomyces californicus]|uniref:hypothetical protein n=1 Tax=Streptomyces californicus TaxID=67351 RepID=UPI0037926A7B